MKKIGRVFLAKGSTAADFIRATVDCSTDKEFMLIEPEAEIYNIFTPVQSL